jgi:hypothetical protein
MTNNPLVEALREARRAIGDHNAPSDCYATGPLTGDPYRDLVECPACSAIAKIDAVLASSAPATGEREQIVGWLRTQSARRLEVAGRTTDPYQVGRMNSYDHAAAAIARGDHRTQSGEMEGGEHG